MKNTKNKLSHGFTLVELIVVIVILSILATIAFLSFSNQSSNARDSTRMSDLSNISKGLGMFNSAGGQYPVPDKAVSIFSGSSLIGYQGEAGNKLLGMIKFSASGGKDPLEGTYYTYNINNNRNKYQLLAFLESKSSFQLGYNPFDIVHTSATDYINRYPYERGDELGILLVQTGTVSNPIYTPIQDVPSIQSSTGFVLTDATQISGKIIITDNTISSTGVNTSVVIGYLSPINPITSTGGSTVCTPGKNTYNFTGNDQTFTIPSGCTKISVKMWGAGGGGGEISLGGGGGFMSGDYLVNGGDTLKIMVGEGGKSGTGNFYTIGISGKSSSAGGGGRSEVSIGANRLFVAGGGGAGGGAAGWSGNGHGGAGGGLIGAKGTQTVGGDGSTAYGGDGGTQIAGGKGGCSTYASMSNCTVNYGPSGSGSIGGTAAGVNNYGGGGNGGLGGWGNGSAGSGGGGYYGGGSGFYGNYYAGGGGGGGGSSYSTASATNSSNIAGSGVNSGNNTDSERNGAGTGGGNQSNGTAGIVIISYQ